MFYTINPRQSPLKEAASDTRMDTNNPQPETLMTIDPISPHFEDQLAK